MANFSVFWQKSNTFSVRKPFFPQNGLKNTTRWWELKLLFLIHFHGSKSLSFKKSLQIFSSVTFCESVFDLFFLYCNLFKQPFKMSGLKAKFSTLCCFSRFGIFGNTPNFRGPRMTKSWGKYWGPAALGPPTGGPKNLRRIAIPNFANKPELIAGVKSFDFPIIFG